MELLTSINFIKDGCEFPPRKSKPRLEGYKLNNIRYKGKYNLGKKLVIKTANGTKTVDWKLPEINYFKLTTNKSLGLMFNEKPSVTCRIPEANKKLLDMIEDSHFWLHCIDSVRTFCSLGDGVLYVYNDNGQARVNAVNPEFWYKVVSANNINVVKCYVLVQPIFEENYYDDIVEDKVTELRVLYHYKGYYIEKYYSYDGSKIGRAIEYTDEAGNVIPVEGIKHDTGIKGFAIHDFNNSKSIDEAFGVSDYEAFADALTLKEKKLSQLDAVTDKHFDPILQVPRTSITENEETGEAEFNGFGNWIAVKDGEQIKYVSWDAKTEAVMELIKSLDSEIAIMSEMGKAFLYGEYANVSGEALKTMIKSALDKVSRHIDSIEPAIKCVLCDMLEIEGFNIKPSDITIQWQDGITESDLTKAQTVKTKIEAGITSRKRAMQKYEGLTAEEAEQDLDMINKETGKGGKGDE